MRLSHLRGLHAPLVTQSEWLEMMRRLDAPIPFVFARHLRVHQRIYFPAEGRVVHVSQLLREVVHVSQSVGQGGQSRGDRTAAGKAGRRCLSCGRWRWERGLLLNDTGPSTGGIGCADDRLHERQSG